MYCAQYDSEDSSDLNAVVDGVDMNIKSGLVPQAEEVEVNLQKQFQTMENKKLTTVTPSLPISYKNFFFYSLLVLLLVNPSSVFAENIARAADDNAKQVNKVIDTKNINKKHENASPTLTPATKQSNVDQNVGEKKGTVSVSISSGTKNVNCSLPKNINSTLCKDGNDGMVSYFLNKMSSNSGMLFRTMYVLLAVTGIVVIYFVIKAIRLRRRRSKSRKYGIITKQGDHGDMEMEPLGDGMDEDDDYTVFEMSRRK